MQYQDKIQNARDARARGPQFTISKSDVKSNLQKHAFLGLLIASLVHMGVIGGYFLVEEISGEGEGARHAYVRLLRYSELGPPPSIMAAARLPAIAVAEPETPKIGIPVPVPAAVAVENTIVSQEEMSAIPSPVQENGLTGGSNLKVTQDIKIDQYEEPDINAFIPVEREPEVVKKVTPEYPDVAKRAGLEGKVWLKVLVGKDGKPVKTVILKSTDDIFNAPSEKAVMQYVFTPAYMRDGPVEVWVSIPVYYKISFTSS